MRTKKNNPQQYFYLRSSVGSGLNRLETELDFFLQREDRTVFNNQQELSRWIEKLSEQCRALNNVHRRSTPSEVSLFVNTDIRMAYTLTARLTVVVYKSKV